MFSSVSTHFLAHHPKIREERWQIGQGDVDLIRNSSLGPFQSLCQDTSSVRIPNRNQQQWPNPAETAMPGPNQHKSVGAIRTRMPGEALCCASFKGKISEDEAEKPMKTQWTVGKLAMQVLCHRPLSSIYIFSKHHMSFHGASAKYHVSWPYHVNLHHMTQPETLILKEIF